MQLFKIASVVLSLICSHFIQLKFILVLSVDVKLASFVIIVLPYGYQRKSGAFLAFFCL